MGLFQTQSPSTTYNPNDRTKPQLQLHKTANPRGLVLVVSLLDVDEGAPQVLTTHGTALRAVR